MVGPLIMPRSATTQTRPMAKRVLSRSTIGRRALTSAVLPGHISVQTGRPSASITTPKTICISSGRWSLEWPRRPSTAPPAPTQGRRVHEDDAELAEQIAPLRDHSLLDQVLHATWRERRGAGLLGLGQLLAEPGHGAVEVVQSKAIARRDGVVGQPLLAGAIGAGSHKPVQGGGEHRPLDRELEGTPNQQLVEHRLDASVLPQPAEQQGRADTPADQPVRIAVPELRQHHRPLGEPGHRGRQAVELATRQHHLLAAEVLDDLLPGPRPLAHALDEVEVGVAVDRFLAQEHGALAARRLRRSQQKIRQSLHNLAAHTSTSETHIQGSQ